MARGNRVDRRTFLKSTAAGATSLVVGGAACSSKDRPGPAEGGPPEGGANDAGSDAPGDAATDAASDAGLAADVGPETGKSRPPNVLFILADQWRAQAAGSAGDVNARTPVLDALAGESVTFAQTVSSIPVCCPYRATLMTSRYPMETGVFLNDVNLAQDPNALAAMFRQAGYDTGYIGKWHLDGQGCRLAFTPPERRQGFSRWAAIECTHDYNNSMYYAGDDGTHRLTWPGYDAIAQTQEMQRWLTERDPATPFFYFLSWGPPHDPYNTAPAEFAALFSPDAIQLRPNVPAANAAEARMDLAGYYSHIAALDSCVGQLLGTLDTLGIADDTIVVFTSDHGEMHRSQGQLWKEQPWDEALLVPFLLRYPAGLGRGPRSVPMRLSTPDILPTLLGLAGVAPPPAIRGRDLSTVLRQQAPPDDEPALIMCVSPFGEWSRALGGMEYRGLRTDRYTYVRNLAGPWMFYDNAADPYQLSNLVGLPDFADVEADLDGQLAARLAAIGDPFREGQWYVDQWGYTVSPDDGAVAYTYSC
jgi:arylsulfatase A-like enzyme